jgi:hypothetical protein
MWYVTDISTVKHRGAEWKKLLPLNIPSQEQLLLDYINFLASEGMY